MRLWRRSSETVYVALFSFDACSFFSYVASCNLRVLLRKLDEAVPITLLICGLTGVVFLLDG